MKNMMKRIALLIALVLMTFVGGYAQEPSQVEKTIDAIVKRYDDVDKVECITVTKGNGLEMFKMLFNKQFGKDFMRGVTSITVINYSDASEETCLALRKELDAFVTLLEEFNLSGVHFYERLNTPCLLQTTRAVITHDSCVLCL